MGYDGEEYDNNPKGLLEKFIDGFYRWAILIMLTFISVGVLALLFSSIGYLLY